MDEVEVLNNLLIINFMEKEKKSLSNYLMNHTLNYLRPKKVFALSEIKNIAMRTLTKLYRTAFRTPDEIVPMFKNYVYDYLFGSIHGYTDGELITNVMYILSIIKQSRNNFLYDYKHHYDKFREFKEWLTPFEVENLSAEVTREILDRIIKEYDATRETIRELA